MVKIYIVVFQVLTECSRVGEYKHFKKRDACALNYPDHSINIRFFAVVIVWAIEILIKI
jgi:hypothetical protein